MATRMHTTRHGDLDSMSVHALLELDAGNARRLTAAHAAARVAVHGFFRGKLGIREEIKELEAERDRIEAALKAAGACEVA